MQQESRLFLVSGKVQGVFFRKTTRDTALRLGITGEVRNLPDGRVEIKATGSEEQMSAFREYCNSGPPKAVVTKLEEKELPYTVFKNFSIIH